MEELSAYEAKRRKRMEENRAVLLGLQIDRLPAPKPRRSASVDKSAAPAERRQSARVRLQQSRSTIQPARLKAKELEAKRQADVRKQQQANYPELPEGTKAIPALPVTLSELPMLELEYVKTGKTMPVATSRLDIDVAEFHEQWLGKQLMPLEVNAILHCMATAGAATETMRTAVCFPTVCVQQFRNALAIFLDVDDDNTLFQTVGGDGTRCVFFPWITRTVWNRNTPVVQRLLRVRRGDARFFLKETSIDIDSSIAGPDEPLLLFLRRSHDGKFVYCGRLGFLGARKTVEGAFEFRWQLLDADALSWMDGRRPRTNSTIRSRLA